LLYPAPAVFHIHCIHKTYSYTCSISNNKQSSNNEMSCQDVESPCHSSPCGTE
jgi:hypothetical protein